MAGRKGRRKREGGSVNRGAVVDGTAGRIRGAVVGGELGEEGGGGVSE